MKKPLVAIAVAVTLVVGSSFATVNVNTAQQSELQRTKGLDKQKAKAIIDYRSQNGFFDSIDDLEKVPGMDRDSLQRATAEIAFSGDPFVPTKSSVKDDKKAQPKR